MSDTEMVPSIEVGAAKSPEVIAAPPNTRPPFVLTLVPIIFILVAVLAVIISFWATGNLDKLRPGRN